MARNRPSHQPGSEAVLTVTLRPSHTKLLLLAVGLVASVRAEQGKTGDAVPFGEVGRTFGEMGRTSGEIGRQISPNKCASHGANPKRVSG